MTTLYLTKAQLNAEINRCLNCPNKPCSQACPVNCQPQKFIERAKSGDTTGAVQIITQNNPMGQTCGLICPDKFCMKACTRARLDFAVNIPKIQATLLENHRKINPSVQTNIISEKTTHSVAVIGAGPAGIAATDELIKQNIHIDLYESANQIGGALNMIPNERLPHTVIEQDAAHLMNHPNVTLRLNTKIKTPVDLLNQYTGIIVATGEPNPILLHITGEEYALSYNEYLLHPEKYVTTGKVAVIGGGNVATDCALTAARMGSKHVEMFIRRRWCDMRISQSEYTALLQNEINLSPLTSPIKIEKTKNGLTLFVQKNQYIDNILTPLENTKTALTGFTRIIAAIGSQADPKIENERIIYAGDCKIGGSTVVEALASGREAARLLYQKLSQKE